MYLEKIGIYPGTFDPVTTGHMDIIERSLKVVDKLIIAIAIDTFKDTVFSISEREEILKEELKNCKFDISNVSIICFKGLLVSLARKMNAKIIIRGIRAISDFEYEFQMSCMNSKLDNEIQTIFLPASEKMLLVSSKIVKEVVKLGGDAYEFASENVQKKLYAKFKIMDL